MKLKKADKAMNLRKQFVKKFGNDNKGVAAIEFALVAPVLTILFLGTVETTQYMTSNTYVTDASANIADLVTRQAIMNDGTLSPIMRAIEPLMGPLDSSTVVFDTTSIVRCEVDGNIVHYVLWSRRWNQASEAFVTPVNTMDDEIDIPNGLLLNDNDTIIMTNLRYKHESIFNLTASDQWTGIGDHWIEEVNFFRPRNVNRINYLGTNVSTNFCIDYTGEESGGPAVGTGESDA